jgi:hypothetical protein
MGEAWAAVLDVLIALGMALLSALFSIATATVAVLCAADLAAKVGRIRREVTGQPEPKDEP